MEHTKQKTAERNEQSFALPKKPQKEKWNFKSDLPFYLLLLPAILIVLIFSYVPMTGLILAFKDWKPKLGLWGSPWAADGIFSNFKMLFSTPALAQSIWNTFYFNVVTTLFEFPAPIILALLINEIQNKYFKKTVQTISYLPHFLSIIAITGIVNSLLSQYGIVNSVLSKLGLPNQTLLEQPGAFLPVYIITSVWKSVGWGTIIYLATLCGLSQETYEAAEIDGAGRFKQALYITLPGIMPTVGMLLILKMGSLFGSSFEFVYGLQNPIGWTQDVIATTVYKNGVTQGEYAVSTALGLMQGAVALILTFGANFISKRVSEVSMW